MTDQEKTKWTIKDSIFTNLFSNSRYMLQLYQSLHPEDHEVQEGDLKTITLENVITDGIYNDLGFMKDDRIMVLVEAQSTWTVNIIIRALEYLVNSYRRYFYENDMDLYKSRKVELPKPELYVIYTGERKTRPAEISLSEEFFGGEKTAIDVMVKMIYDGSEGDIINQYVMFTKILNEQVKTYGRNRKAVKEAIRICKDRNILKEYLEKRESEVVDIMMQLYDQEEIMRMHIQSERKDSGIMNVVQVLKGMGFSFSDIVNKIAEQFHLSSEKAEKEVKGYWD